ncbi:MAG: hypothetical protein A2Z29_02495 [Chloroflexi bacterium RBG_16_56_11]|nr:MAG: hypothetical protein A2Z29_02495 [Chloroflexi bacterium RBG_16_56_11]
MQTKLIIGLALTLVVLIFIPVYWATESGRQARAAEWIKTESAGRGAGTYALQCISCHGQRAAGGIGPALRGSQLDDAALARIISRGIAGTIMPAFGENNGGVLTERQITDLVTYLKNVDIVPGDAETPQNFIPENRASLSDGAADSSVGKTIFESKCNACHSLGGGRRIGPDLKDVTLKRDEAWLLQKIASPDKLDPEEDAITRELVAEYGLSMPDLGLSEQEAAEVIAYIRGAEAPPASTPPLITTPPPVETLPAITGDADIGRDIFTGKVPLENGGGACISCHNIAGAGALGGGTLAKDMTDAYSRLGEAGLTAIIKTAPFPIMKEIYGEQPLTDAEVAHLVVYLGEVDRAEKKAVGPGIMVTVSIAGFLVVLLVLQFVWRQRLGGVRRNLVKGGSR